MPIFDKRYLEYVRSALRDKMDASHAPTAQSWSYRKRASELARAANASPDIEQQVELIKQALQWVQLAENEEFMAAHRPVSNDN